MSSGGLGGNMDTGLTAEQVLSQIVWLEQALAPKARKPFRHPQAPVRKCDRVAFVRRNAWCDDSDFDRQDRHADREPDDCCALSFGRERDQGRGGRKDLYDIGWRGRSVSGRVVRPGALDRRALQQRQAW